MTHVTSHWRRSMFKILLKNFVSDINLSLSHFLRHKIGFPHEKDTSIHALWKILFIKKVIFFNFIFFHMICGSSLRTGVKWKQKQSSSDIIHAILKIYNPKNNTAWEKIWPISLAVNPQYLTSRIESYTVFIQCIQRMRFYTECCYSKWNVVVCHNETGSCCRSIFVTKKSNEICQILTQLLSFSFRFKWPTPGSHQNRNPSKAQAEQKTPDSFHSATARRFGKKVPTEAVPLHRGTCRILGLSQADRDASQDLVSEPTGQIETASRIRNGEAAACINPSHAKTLWSYTSITDGWTPRPSRIS